jgi:hypothetical protein
MVKSYREALPRCALDHKSQNFQAARISYSISMMNRSITIKIIRKTKNTSILDAIFQSSLYPLAKPQPILISSNASSSKPSVFLTKSVFRANKAPPMHNHVCGPRGSAQSIQ